MNSKIYFKYGNLFKIGIARSPNYKKFYKDPKSAKLKRQKLLKTHIKKANIDLLINDIKSLIIDTVERYQHFDFNIEALSEYMKVSIKDTHRALSKVRPMQGYHFKEINRAPHETLREFNGSGNYSGGWIPTWYVVTKVVKETNNENK